MISVKSLTKRYGTRTAVENISFHVEPGEIVGFLGPNGAGKSTTMKVLTGFMPATEGEVLVAGIDVFGDPIGVKRQIGYLPETPPVYLEMTVSDYVRYAAALHEVPKNKLKSAVDLALQKTNLTEVRGRVIGNLSKGFRQRVGLAQALVHEPKVLVLDEPTVGLDPKQIIEIRELIRGLQGKHTVILSSHILPEVTATCSRIIVINRGKIVAEDTLDQLASKVAKGLVYNLTIAHPERGIDSLRTLAGVKEASLHGNRVTIEIDPAQTTVREAIVETAVRNGLGVQEFVSERMSLEEIFLKLTTQDADIERSA